MPKNDESHAVGPLAEARQALKQSLANATSANQKLDLLISTNGAEQLVPTMPAQELFYVIKEVGLSDSQELVHLAGPRQFQAFVDLDGWKGERVEVDSVLFWLRAARGDEDEERYKRKLALLDIELVELLLKETLIIHDLEEDDDPEMEGNFYRSTEGRYIVEFKVEGTEYMGIKGLLDDMYAEDPFKAARMLEAVRWETSTELEESALRWRTGRLADLGFPGLGEAMAYYSYVDPDAALPALTGSPAVPEGFFLTRIEPSGLFFDRAVAMIQDDERDVVERQLVTVMNAVMVVAGVDPGEQDQVQAAIGSARDTLSLGLEHAARGDAELAAQLLSTVPLKRVFQVGVSLALKLKFRVDRLMKAGTASLPQAKDVPLLDPPVGEALLGLRRKRPLFCASLRDRQAAPEQLRPFRDLEDVARAAEAVEMAEKLSELMGGLGFDSRAVGERITALRGADVAAGAFVRFSELFLTAVAREAVGEGFAFDALPAGRLMEWATQAFEVADGAARVKPAFETLLRTRLEAKGAELSETHIRAARLFADYCLQRLTEDVGRPFAAGGTLTAKMPLPLLLTAE